MMGFATELPFVLPKKSAQPQVPLAGVKSHQDDVEPVWLELRLSASSM